ncbi:MAG TPA: acetyl-CoA carboxylase biotin carboxyl carrier protein [Trebonia sp.]|jgi:acetyl-CoA carboxylase biotin carboxyl carrier protein|nr:acetyl-CoA carboxylase biotin carboxyl carrier protein [Trebonia sp.]
MADNQSADLAELREHARALATGLAGPLKRVRVRSGDLVVEVEWQPAGGGPAAGAAPAPGPAAVAAGEVADEGAGEGLLVTSPMVGTFYRSPEPGAAPFVDVGDTVKPGQAVAIVEAMKLLNPIVCEHHGVVAAILVDNGKPVEFGQPLLRVVPESPDERV